jgi:hypothetical protein
MLKVFWLISDTVGVFHGGHRTEDAMVDGLNPPHLPFRMLFQAVDLQAVDLCPVSMLPTKPPNMTRASGVWGSEHPQLFRTGRKISALAALASSQLVRQEQPVESWKSAGRWATQEGLDGQFCWSVVFISPVIYLKVVDMKLTYPISYA